MSLIDHIGAERRDALRSLAAAVGASDDTAVMAWAAWQTFAGMEPDERTKALSVLIGLEEIKRITEGREPMFKVETRRVVKSVPLSELDAEMVGSQ